ncbi:MAG: hypothetical protein E4H21_06460 [Thermodesulfobacteriales bacterium]|nr:MAG: hypothetical protein E4H21_06460 [Thermodesulfobacteriales bacterium]
MKKLLLFSVFALMVVSFSAGVFAQDGATKMMKKTDTGVELSGTVVMTATVQSLNVKDRLIVLTDAAGNVQVVNAGPEVKNFDQIALGDEVTAEFYESVALQLAGPDTEPAEGEAMGVMTAAKGEKPGMVAIDVISEIVTVEAIDKANQKVKLKGADGQVATVKVDPSIGDLTKIKVGDKIRVTYTKALAISVQNP